MSSYKYEVITAGGKIQKGSIDAMNLEIATSELKAGGNTIISLSAANALSKDMDIHIGKAVSSREMSVFCRQFESVLNAGVTVIVALDMLAEQTENKTFKKTLEAVRDDVQKGESLAGAMQKFPKIFPPIMIHMMEAGEASGSLDITFKRLSEHFEKGAHIKSLIMKSMMYPIILLIVIVVVVAIMMVKIVPTFVSAFDEVGAGELPGITLAVMAISDFFVDYWYVMVIVVVAIVLLYKGLKSTDMGAMLIGKTALKFPLVGTLIIKNASATLTRTMSTLMTSGIQMVDAIHIVTGMMGNSIVKHALMNAEEEVKNGIQLSKPIADSGVFPPMVYHMMEIGEETGNMEDMLDKVAEYYDEEVQSATEALMAALEPLMIVLMACIVVPIVLAIMLPMYSVYDAIDQSASAVIGAIFRL